MRASCLLLVVLGAALAAEKDAKEDIRGSRTFGNLIGLIGLRPKPVVRPVVHVQAAPAPSVVVLPASTITVSQPAPKPVYKPVVKPVVQHVVKPVVQPVVQQVVQPVVQPAPQPIVLHPAPQPVYQPVSEPLYQPVVEQPVYPSPVPVYPDPAPVYPTPAPVYPNPGPVHPTIGPVHPQPDQGGLVFSWHVPELAGRQFTWGQADAECKARGLRLVSIDNPRKNDFISRSLEKDNIPFTWTSGQLGGPTGWQWSATGQPVQYTNWGRVGQLGRPQPDNAEGNEHCLAVLNRFYPGDGVTWHDIGCHHPKPFICE
ncbi:hypothetical protein FJT64_013342 [Amphibalanus amphitrite]|uniref:C-type lectin domain-containing protein n=1 Tax=Amphibalanus amphitrite TaxID=1232801 RepID=A0A6A4VD40_AMPAM|nr:hypothetical protein FJT64_013342 [Amphibalanus amphitrite]